MAEAIKEYDLFSDVWRLFRKYYIISADQEYWNDLLREVHEIENKHNSKLCIDLLFYSLAKDISKRILCKERGLSHEEESGNII